MLPKESAGITVCIPGHLIPVHWPDSLATVHLYSWLPFWTKLSSSEKLILYLIENMGKVSIYISISSIPSSGSSIWLFSSKPTFTTDVDIVRQNFSLKCNFYLSNRCAEDMWCKPLEMRLECVSFFVCDMTEKMCTCSCIRFKNL